MTRITLSDLSTSQDFLEEVDLEKSRSIVGGNSFISSGGKLPEDIKSDGLTYIDGVIPCNPFTGLNDA